jgi:hypothetical protein
MHKLNVCHGNLHSNHIVFKGIGDDIEFRIIDFKNAFYISEGIDDPEVLELRTTKINPEVYGNTYNGFVDYDHKNWQTNLFNKEKVSFSEILEFTEDEEQAGDYGSYAIFNKLSSRLNWKLFGIYLVNKNEVYTDAEPNDASLIGVQLPCGKYFINLKIDDDDSSEDFYTMEEIRIFILKLERIIPSNTVIKLNGLNIDVNDSDTEVLFQEINDFLPMEEIDEETENSAIDLVDEFIDSLDIMELPK